MLFATACGSDSSSDSGSSESGTTIKHKFGTTKVPKDPKRIVTLGYNDHEFLLAMGVEPIAIRDWVGVGPVTKVPWAKDEIAAMKTKPKVIPRTDLKPEEVIKLKPDLIISVFGGMKKREYDTLSKFAPVVAPPKQYVDFGVPWEEQALITGKAVGKEEQAEKLVADLEGRFDKAREEHPEFEGKAGIVPYAFPGEYGAYASGDLRTRFITKLGFKIAQGDRQAGRQGVLRGVQRRAVPADGPGHGAHVRRPARQAQGHPGRQALLAAERREGGPRGLHGQRGRPAWAPSACPAR